MSARYNTFGHGYSAQRQPDPQIAARIHQALGDARTVLNVGAGSGNYEPEDRVVVAVEPSGVMAAQRPRDRPPAVLASAEALPFADDSVDAVMASLTIHHWTDVPAGLREAARVARRRIVLLTIDPLVEAQMWLLRDYLPDVTARDLVEFPAIDQLRDWLGPQMRCDPVPVPRDCRDGFLLSFWDRPERVLDADARGATSGFARLAADRESAVVTRLARDLATGAWDRNYGALRALTEYDAGLRLITATQG
jgi:SAM-dependent methyltransferase